MAMAMGALMANRTNRLKNRDLDDHGFALFGSFRRKVESMNHENEAAQRHELKIIHLGNESAGDICSLTKYAKRYP